MSDYVTKVEVIARLANDSDYEWDWTVRVYTANGGEAFLRKNGVASVFNPARPSMEEAAEFAAEAAVKSLPDVIEEALRG